MRRQGVPFVSKKTYNINNIMFQTILRLLHMNFWNIVKDISLVSAGKRHSEVPVGELYEGIRFEETL